LSTASPPNNSLRSLRPRSYKSRVSIVAFLQS
jgi:hypothetical protein